MTSEETRQLGIEFERRLNTLDPNTVFNDKPDTDTIYSYLNQAQDKLFKTVYLLDAQFPSGSKQAIRAEKILSPLLVISNSILVTPADYNLYTKRAAFDFTDKYYIRSVSMGLSSLDNAEDPHLIENVLIKQSDAALLDLTNFNGLKIMRRIPCTIDNHGITLYHDAYTTISEVVIHYYEKPPTFLPKINANRSSFDECKLPMDCFEDIVNEALDLYVRHRYKISLKNAELQNQLKRQQLQEDNNEQKSEEQ